MIRSAAIFMLLLISASPRAVADKRPTPARPKESLSQLAEKHFAHWDRNHDDALELSEVDHLIEDHSLHGRQTALLVCLRHHLTKKGNPPVLPHQALMKLIEQPDFAKTVERTAMHLETIDRELFLPTDPNLASFHQGRLGDCYLLAAIAAQVQRSPESIRAMIHPEVTGGFLVVFGDGLKIEVPPLTDGELLLGAKLDSRHGSWLAVLEKSYGIIRTHERAKKDKAARAAEIVPEETLSSGNSGVIISLLTGRRAKSMRLGESSHADQVRKLLAETTKKRRLVCAGTGRTAATPPGIGKHHAYAILGYDERQRQVRVFNPLGNNFTPKGPAGTTNGYPTKNGQFTIPVDQFGTVFSSLVYETGRPFVK